MLSAEGKLFTVWPKGDAEQIYAIVTFFIIIDRWCGKVWRSYLSRFPHFANNEYDSWVKPYSFRCLMSFKTAFYTKCPNENLHLYLHIVFQ